MMEEDKVFRSQYSIRAIYFAAPTEFYVVRDFKLDVKTK